jgi:hypothetical protein
VKEMTMAKRNWVIAAFLSLGITACGSGETRKQTFPVTGKIVLADGKPAQHALVVLHSTTPEAGAEPLRPRGKVSSDGSFKLTTYDGDDGAPAGKYTVSLELWLAGARAEDPPVNKLPAKYSKPETSGIEVTINEGPTEVPTIQLKR